MPSSRTGAWIRAGSPWAVLGDVPVKHRALKYQRRSHKVLEHFDVIQYDELVADVLAGWCTKFRSAQKSTPKFIKTFPLRWWKWFSSLFRPLYEIRIYLELNEGGKKKQKKQERTIGYYTSPTVSAYLIGYCIYYIIREDCCHCLIHWFIRSCWLVIDLKAFLICIFKWSGLQNYSPTSTRKCSEAWWW